MKRVFFLFILMIGVFFISQAKPPFDGFDLPGMITSDTYNADEGGCGVGCVVKKPLARILFGNTGGCSFSFYYYNAPTILTQDLECAGLSIRFSWDFGDSTPPTTPSSGLFSSHSFPGNGTYLVCVTTIVYNAMGIPCDTLQPPVCVSVVVTNCTPPCDPLDCSKIEIKSVDTTQVTFTFPLEDCADCLDPHYKIGWREKYGTSGWTYSGFLGTTINELTLPDLDPCKEYEIIIELRCNGASGAVTDSCVFDFMTDCRCDPGLDCDKIILRYGDRASFTFSFQPIDCPDCPNPYYNIGWRVSGTTNPWNYGGTSYYVTGDNSYGQGQVFSLAPCTTYDLIIELKCPDSSSTVNPWQTPTVEECIKTAFYATPCGLVAPDRPFTPALPVQTTAYPNPARDEVQILVTSDQDAEGVIQIFNNLGALVKQLNAQTNAPAAVSLQGLEAGVYHYTFIAESGANLRASGKLALVK